MADYHGASPADYDGLNEVLDTIRLRGATG